MQRRSRANRGLTLLVLLAPLALFACGEGDSRLPAVYTPVAVEADSTASAASGPASSRAANFAVRFMEMMIDHHAMAVHMSEMCMEKATHGELRSLCAQIKQAQASEIQTMQSWLQGWYGTSHTPEMKDGGQMARLMSLEGEEFEIAFMKMIIRHHRAAVKEGLKCVDRAEHRELIQLCENIVESQRREIQQMESWLCQWYRVWCSASER